MGKGLFGVTLEGGSVAQQSRLPIIRIGGDIQGWKGMMMTMR